MRDVTAKKVILVVDDDSTNIRYLVELLRSTYSILVAKDGKTALRIARSDAAPDLILLDVMLPDIDGYEVCRELRNDVVTGGIPIIFISGKDGKEDEVRGFETGAADYLTKPFQPVIVKARVAMHLELKGYRALVAGRSI